MRRNVISWFVFFICIVLLGVSTGCSLFGGGKKKDGEDDAALSEADLEKRYAMGNIPLAEGEGMFKDVIFDYDSSAVSDAGRQMIEYNIQVIQANPNVSIKLEGHCDERGTAEYNLALGAERAKAVRDVLQSYGVSASKLSTISYGEEIPLDPGHDESAYARNRRVHFAVDGTSSGQANY